MIILRIFCPVCGILYSLAKNTCLSCLQVDMVLKEFSPQLLALQQPFLATLWLVYSSF